MCGLAGMARHPDAPKLELALLVFDELMGEIETRGRHATGFAAKTQSGGAKDFIWKRAAPVSVVRKSEVWGRLFTTMPRDVTSLIGHTRWSTHASNTYLDDAAHPYEFGKIVGAHNGIIHNWCEIAEKFGRKDLIVDSQAAFLALDQVKDPVKALDLLDGYFALTWTKGLSLFMARTNDAPLSCAYLSEMRTMFWTSERMVLMRVLRNANLGDFEIWDARPNTVYRYVPSLFNEKGTNVEKKDAPFRGRRGGTRMINSARPTVVTRTPLAADRAEGWRARGWDSTTARYIETPNPPRDPGRVRSIKDTDDRVDTLADKLDSMAKRIGKLERVLDMLIDTIGAPDDECDPCARPTCAVCAEPEDMAQDGRLHRRGDGLFVHTRCIGRVKRFDSGPYRDDDEPRVKRFDDATQADGVA